MYPAPVARIAVPLMSATACLCSFVVSPAVRHSTYLILKIVFLYVATGFKG